ncbi:lipase chaperone [Moritella sp. 24]|uniref:lipase secretion chaperone n=1 Tax=Moritella sp. 24 TaxID=2746230 RepID=UPI001BAB9A9F|nr:lipase secretion chaperone [Moritella sp. 24]QUM76810.1 lipase chaperone [Moritella sp. 24]
MNKIAVTSVMLIAVGTAIFTYQWNNGPSLSFEHSDVENTVQQSQQDTSIDATSERDTFEYFLSGVEDKDLGNLQAQFIQFNLLRPADQQIDKVLFQQYINYKTYLQTLESDTNSVEFGLDELTALNDKLLAAQLQFFTLEQQELLFGEENKLRTSALKKIELQQIAVSGEEFNALWQQELQLLPEEEQVTYRNEALIGALANTQGLDAQDQYLIRQELVGADGAERLAELDTRVEVFNTKVDRYLVERQQLIADDSLTAEELALAITDLREVSFSTAQLRRIKALERINDSKNNG